MPNAQAAEVAGLPLWFYPLGFWVTLALLALGLFWPALSWLGVVAVGGVPVLAALWVVVSGRQKDPPLAKAAAAALVGLVVVFGVRQLLK